MERSVPEELAELLKKKNTDFLSMSKLHEAQSAALKKLKLKEKMPLAKIVEKLEPHLGNDLAIRNVGKSKYLTFKLSDEVLLFRIVQKSAGKKPGAQYLPFQKAEYLTLMNRLLEQGVIRVKLDKNYGPLLYPAQKFDEAHGKDVCEEKFKEAYFELERGRFYVRICDLRRHLGWGAREFDRVLTGLRDAGKIQLQGGDIDYFTKEDIGASFIDENGTLKLTAMWRQ